MTDTLDSPEATTVDSLAEHRASGNCAPADWGFMLDDGRLARLQQMIASGKRLQPWALRECQRLHVVVRDGLKKAA